jgi:hypothetical protein
MDVNGNNDDANKVLATSSQAHTTCCANAATGDFTFERAWLEKQFTTLLGVNPFVDLPGEFKDLLQDELNEFKVRNLSQTVLFHMFSTFLQFDNYEEAEKWHHKINCSRHDVPIETTRPIGGPVNFPFADMIAGYRQIKVLLLRYLLDCFYTIESEKQAKSHPLKGQTLLESMSCQCVSFAILLLSQKIEVKNPLRSSSPLFPFVLHRSIPDGFLVRLMTVARDDSGDCLELIFQPLLLQLFLTMEKVCSISLENEFKQPLQALLELCSVKVGDIRPVCHLVSQMICTFRIPPND